MKLSQAKLESIWNRVQNIPYIFNDFTRGDKELYLSVFFKEDTIAYEIGDVGLAYFTDVTPPVNACGHIIFWDRTFKDRIKPCQEICKEIFDKYDIHRITGIIPVFNKAAILFSKKIGFKIEGVSREVIMSLGKWHDAVVLGCLRRDIDG